MAQLCGYIKRPPLAKELVRRSHAGQVVLRLKKTLWRDGTTRIVMSPLELMQRLAALVPRPGLHLICFHGVRGWPERRPRRGAAIAVVQCREAPTCCREDAHRRRRGPR